MKAIDLFIDKLEQFDGVLCLKETEHSVRVAKGLDQWIVSPAENKVKSVLSGNEYRIDPKTFIASKISNKISLPENFGKIWDDREKDHLYECFNDNLTAIEIADSLGRTVGSIAEKIADNALGNCDEIVSAIIGNPKVPVYDLLESSGLADNFI